MKAKQKKGCDSDNECCGPTDSGVWKENVAIQPYAITCPLCTDYQANIWDYSFAIGIGAGTLVGTSIGMLLVLWI